MLLKTHTAVAAVIALYFDYRMCLSYPSYASNILARIIMLFTAILLQLLIDEIGHNWVTVEGRNVPVRNKWHSLPGTLAIGLAAGLPFYLILHVNTVLVMFACVMLSHWLLDLVTEGGAYVVGRKVRTAGIRYDSIWWNRAGILVFSPLLVFVNPVVEPGYGPFNMLLYSSVLAYTIYSVITI